jgi:hypothetical protein
MDEEAFIATVSDAPARSLTVSDSSAFIVTLSDAPLDVVD